MTGIEKDILDIENSNPTFVFTTEEKDYIKIENRLNILEMFIKLMERNNENKSTAIIDFDGHRLHYVIKKYNDTYSTVKEYCDRTINHWEFKEGCWSMS